MMAIRFAECFAIEFLFWTFVSSLVFNSGSRSLGGFTLLLETFGNKGVHDPVFVFHYIKLARSLEGLKLT